MECTDSPTHRLALETPPLTRIKLIWEDLSCVPTRDPAARGMLETLLISGRSCRHLASAGELALARQSPFPGETDLLVCPVSYKYRHPSRGDHWPPLFHRSRRRSCDRRNRDRWRRCNDISRRHARRRFVVARQAPSNSGGWRRDRSGSEDPWAHHNRSQREGRSEFRRDRECDARRDGRWNPCKDRSSGVGAAHVRRAHQSQSPSDARPRRRGF